MKEYHIGLLKQNGNIDRGMIRNEELEFKRQKLKKKINRNKIIKKNIIKKLNNIYLVIKLPVLIYIKYIN